MSNLIDDAVLGNVREIATTDRVLGGPLGTINLQAQDLIARDQILQLYIPRKCEIALYSGPAGTATVWNVLNTSIITGIDLKNSIVHLKTKTSAQAGIINFRTNGHDEGHPTYPYDSGLRGGLVNVTNNVMNHAQVITDFTGSIQWLQTQFAVATNITITLEAYQRLMPH
jgi:hypothetical protein